MKRAQSKPIRRHWAPPLLALLLATAALAGCVKPMVQVEDLSQVGQREVIVVGRVELVPPLKPGEQDIKLMGPYNDENQYFFFINSKRVEIPDTVEKTPYEDILQAKFGETFYVKNPQRPAHFTVMFVYMTLTRQMQERIWLPGNFVVEPQPGDRAVYMGTIRYHRNEFFDIEKVELVDEYDRERRAFQEKFGSGATLTRRLARSASG